MAGTLGPGWVRPPVVRGHSTDRRQVVDKMMAPDDGHRLALVHGCPDNNQDNQEAVHCHLKEEHHHMGRGHMGRVHVGLALAKLREADHLSSVVGSLHVVGSRQADSQMADSLLEGSLRVDILVERHLVVDILLDNLGEVRRSSLEVHLPQVHHQVEDNIRVVDSLVAAFVPCFSCGSAVQLHV